jgi:hypothetical protein
MKRHGRTAKVTIGGETREYPTGYLGEGVRREDTPIPPAPWLPAPYDDADIAAMKAMAHGQAEPYQQQLALRWILYMLGTAAPCLVPGDQYMQSAAAGKQWGGQQIFKLIEKVHNRKADSEHGI